MHQSKILALSWQNDFIAFSYDNICDLIYRENRKLLFHLACSKTDQNNFDILEKFFF